MLARKSSLANLCNCRRGGSGGNFGSNTISNIVNGSRSTILRDMAWLTTLVAALPSGVQRPSIRCGTVTRNVTQFAARIALHSIGLTVSGIMIWSSAFVASGRTVGCNVESTTSRVSTTTNKSSTSTSHGRGRVRGWAAASKVTHLATRVASATLSTTAQAQGWTVSLDVAKALAMVALLGFSGTRHRALIRLMSGLFAIVAQSLRRRADFGVVTNIATFVACATT